MGRKKKYITLEEQLTARRERQMKHYWKHAETLKHKNLERYYKNKEKSI